MVERCWAIKRADLRKKAGCIPPEPTSNKVWLLQNSGKFQKDLLDDQSILEETLILPVFFFLLSKKKHFLSTNVTASSLKFVIDKLTDT